MPLETRLTGRSSSSSRRHGMNCRRLWAGRPHRILGSPHSSRSRRHSTTR